jgi:hypothetical protein
MAALFVCAYLKRSQNFALPAGFSLLHINSSDVSKRRFKEFIMAERKAPHSLKDQTADQIRNEQRGGDVADPSNAGPEANATMRKVWDEPGGEAYAYRQSMGGAGNRDEGHDELTAAETPETTKHLSDASLSPKDKDATSEAIERATAVNGKDKD